MTVPEIAPNNEENVGEATDREGQPFTAPILPLKDTVVYPLTVVPLAVGQERSLKLVDDVASGDRIIALVAQKDPELALAGPGEVFEVGTLGKIHQMLKMPDGTRWRRNVPCSFTTVWPALSPPWKRITMSACWAR